MQVVIRKREDRGQRNLIPRIALGSQEGFSKLTPYPRVRVFSICVKSSIIGRRAAP